MAHEQLRDLLQACRAGGTPAQVVADWLGSHQDVASAELKRNAYLKLRHGDPVPAFLDYLPACLACSQVHRSGEFLDYPDFERCDDQVKKAEAAGVLAYIDQPAWYKVPAGVLGGESFYACATCAAIWKITLPERAQKGGWYRAG